MEGMTLSEWVKIQLHRPSIIKHPPGDELVFICRHYFFVAKNNYAIQIIGLFHLDYLNEQKLKQPTPQGIEEALLGGCSISLVRKNLAELHQYGWLEKEIRTAQENKALLCKKSPQAFNLGFLMCDWCKCSTVALQEHHYPIQKSEGGKAIVHICANCHFEFHHLMSVPQYKPSQKLIDFFEMDLEKIILHLEEVK